MRFSEMVRSLHSISSVEHLTANCARDVATGSTGVHRRHARVGDEL